MTAGRCSSRVLARIQLICAFTVLAVIQLIVSAVPFSFFFFFFLYMGSLLPCTTSSTSRRARSSTKHFHCARRIQLYLVVVLIATFPSAIMAGGGEGDGVHSFAPPPVPLFSEGPIYRNSCEAGPDLPKRGGRNRQSDGCTEFIFLTGRGGHRPTN